MRQPWDAAQSDLAAAVHSGQSEFRAADWTARLETALDALQAAEKALPRTSFDPDAVVRDVGRDPMRLLGWVKTRTALVPYPGALRGAIGVLQDRVGNSLDRALLLAELLKRAGVRAKLARATLTTAQTDSLATTVAATQIPEPETSVTMSEPVASEFFRTYADKFGGQSSELKNRLTANRVAMESIGAETARRADVQRETLMRIAGKSLAVGSDTSTSSNELSDHWWVQMASGNSWVDLDPTGLAGPGMNQVRASSALDPSELDREVFQSVRVRVGIECLCQGSLEERTVVEQTFRLSDVNGVSIVLRHVPTSVPPTDLLAGQNAGTAAVAWLAEQTEWLAILSAGVSTVASARITTDGEVRAAAGRAFQPKDAVGGLADAFGGGNDTPSHLTAEFIDYEIRVPGQVPRIERRILFDWLTPKVRQAKPVDTGGQPPVVRTLDLAHEVEILLLGAQPSGAFVAHLAAQDVIARRSALLRAVSGQSSVDELLRGSTPAAAFPADLYSLALNRMALSPNRDKQYLAEPNILSRHRELGGSPARAVASSAFDIVTGRLRLRSGNRAESVAANVHQGVLDANTELMVASLEMPSVNIAEVMTASPSPERWRLVDQSEDMRVSAALAGGSMVVVPAGASVDDPLSLGWWQIDKQTGATVGFTARGWGGTQAEPAITTEEMLKVANFAVKLVLTIGCIAGVALKTILGDQQNLVQNNYRAPRLKSDLLILACMVTGGMTSIGGLMGGVTGQALSLVGNGAGLPVLAYTIFDLLSVIKFFQ